MTTLRLSIPHQRRIRVTVHDLSGRRVRTLLDSEVPPGERYLVWDGLNDDKRRITSGIYWIVLTSAHHRESVKIVGLER
jgi:hypothetical protein